MDVKDIREFAWEYNLPLLPEFSDKLDSIEAEEEIAQQNIKRTRSVRR
ncbi:MAG: hypothetical protein ACE5E5_00475 [Phycisphaerae bacterium]